MSLPGATSGRSLVSVHSRDDVYQWVDVLKRNRAKRRKHGELVVEGVVPINHALAEGWPVRALVYDRDRALSGWALDVLDRCPQATRVAMAGPLLAELSEREDPSELLMVAGMREAALQELPVQAPAPTVVLDRPSNPGNLGSILRSCSAFGCKGVIVLGHAADPFDPLSVRASLGAVFSVPIAVSPSGADFDAWLAARRADSPGLQVLGADPAGPSPLPGLDFSRPTVVVLGNERLGLGLRLRQVCDLTFSIPMAGIVDSLNLAAAATVVLYEADRQRRARAVA